MSTAEEPSAGVLTTRSRKSQKPVVRIVWREPTQEQARELIAAMDRWLDANPALIHEISTDGGYSTARDGD